jgi:putative chitinase
MSISTLQLSKIAPNLKEPKLTLFCNALNAAMDSYSISTDIEQAGFIAQVMHESGECRYVKELASGSAYEGRKDLGNTQVGDGVKFKGRGLIQITGRNNYKSLSDAFGVDFIAHPEKLEEPDYAAKSAAWFWSTHKLSAIMDANTEDAFKIVTHRINGGYNGLDDRLKYWARAKEQLGV